MFSSKQSNFLSSLQMSQSPRQGGDSKDDTRDIVVVWRTESDQAKYEWLRNIWNGHKEFVNSSSEKLIGKIDGFLRGKAVLSRDAALGELIDEYGPGLYTRFARRVMRLWEQLMFHITKEEFLPALSVAGTIGVIMLVGYCLNYATVIEEQRERQERAARENLLKKKKPGEESNGASQSRPEPWQKVLRELRAETYFGMIRLLKPGCRTIVVVIDKDRKEELLRQFARCIWPWRNNKTLYFGYICIEKNLDWFRRILEYTLPTVDDEQEPEIGPTKTDPRLKNINPKQVVGTVLSLNGWRLYFSMYHPKHAPSMEGYTVSGGLKHRVKKGSQSARSLGFESDNSQSSSDEESAARSELERIQRKRILETNELLEGLPNWLDRLFEGTTRRYYLPAWPELK